MAADPALIAQLQSLCEQATKLNQMAAQLCKELADYIQQAQTSSGSTWTAPAQMAVSAATLTRLDT